jgi:hypothetical protein
LDSQLFAARRHGAISVVAHYSVMYLFVQAGVPGIPASALGFGAGALTKFAHVLLESVRAIARDDGAGTRFVVAIGLQLVVNTLLLASFLKLGLSLWPRRWRRRC